MTMPEKIFLQQGANQKIGDDHVMTLRKWSLEDFKFGTKYIRHDLYEVLEAENKMLADAVLALFQYEDKVSQHYAEAIALAQRIGGKNETNK